jgi:hypothetical protein
MTSSTTYEVYDEHGTVRALLPKPIKPHLRCYGCMATLLTYLLVAYISADATLMACLKTNCSSSTDSTLVITNGTAIDLHDNSSMTYLIVSEAVALAFLMMLFCTRYYRYLCYCCLK